MDIKIGEDFRIVSESMCITVLRRRIIDPTKAPNWPKLKAEGRSPELREEWRESTYHTTIEQAMRSILQQKVRESEAESMAELLAEIKEIKREISEVLNTEGYCIQTK
ncbi:hypothetical protein [Bacillus chungangensis]|uniref:Flagellar biosynthesis protein FliP n=1 Tax=Bacillus chungangensis TaxID=587633 RepID=A0ABT9WME0_9BACI|nr:hypothetical protein [Bacillus chungangensis]MDQ0174457.1 flagellar biosynthesis protein FliP [Bacillus chungangensis]